MRNSKHARSQLTRLEVENEALRALTLKLGRIVLTSAGNVSHISDKVRAPLFDVLSPDQIVAALRELALECERLVRISDGTEAAEEFEAIGIEFADIASQIETAFRIPAGASAAPGR